MFDLDLSRCPICQTQRQLIRQAREVKGQHFIWYECPECASALMWMGGDRWIYQKVGRPDRQYLARRPLTTVELYALSVATSTPMAAPDRSRPEPPTGAEPDWLRALRPAKAEPETDWHRPEPPAKAKPDWYRQETPAQAEPTYDRDEPPAQAEADWLSALRPAQAEPVYYRDEPAEAAGGLYSYEPEPIAAPAPLPAETPAAARPKGMPRSLVIAIGVIALLCAIAAVVILLTQG